MAHASAAPAATSTAPLTFVPRPSRDRPKAVSRVGTSPALRPVTRLAVRSAKAVDATPGPPSVRPLARPARPGRAFPSSAFRVAASLVVLVSVIGPVVALALLSPALPRLVRALSPALSPEELRGVERLVEMSEAMLANAGRPAEAVLGGIDAIKLRSSMTLFATADPQRPVFARVLEEFFDGPDPMTAQRIAAG